MVNKLFKIKVLAAVATLANNPPAGAYACRSTPMHATPMHGRVAAFRLSH